MTLEQLLPHLGPSDALQQHYAQQLKEVQGKVAALLLANTDGENYKCS